jgi:hypothetical protein
LSICFNRDFASAHFDVSNNANGSPFTTLLVFEFLCTAESDEATAVAVAIVILETASHLIWTPLVPLPLV